MEKFFQIIRKINQLILLVLLLVGLVFAVFIAKDLFFRDKPTANINVIEKEISEKSPDATPVQKAVELHNFEKVNGNDLFSYGIYENYNQRYTTDVYAPSNSVHRNTIYISTKDRKTRLLLPTYNYVILDREVISYRLEKSNNPSSIKLNYYKILKNDLNSDGKQDSDEKITLFFSHFDGTEMREVLTDIDSVLSIDFLEPTKISAIYKKNDQIYSTFFDATNFAKIGNETLINLSLDNL